jgi:hypothetical protein
VIRIFYACLIFIFTTVSAVSEIKLQRYSTSTYTNSSVTKSVVGQLGNGGSENNTQSLNVIRVGFRQYGNPYINSSSSLTLDNRFNLVGDQDILTQGDVLIFPNPFRLRDGGLIQYYLNKPEDIRIEIYDMFGKNIFKSLRKAGSTGARNNLNSLAINALAFNYFDIPAGVYFLYIINQSNRVIGKTKFVIVP